MSKCMGQGGGGRRRRYTSAEHACGLYLSLQAKLSGLQALDYEVACNRPQGGSVEVKSEPVGLDDWMALKGCLERVQRAATPQKWRLWELQRLNLMSCRDAAKAYNTAHIEAGGEKTGCISHTTALTWKVELDALFEQVLQREGLIRVRIDGEGDR